MRILKIQAYLSDSELKKLMNSQKSVTDFKDYLIIYSVQTNQGKTATELAKILCVKTDKIYKTVEKYNRLGITWKTNAKRGGRREERCIMSLEKEKDFLKQIENDAINGHIITYRQIKMKLEKLIDKTVSDDYIWDLFKRHKWAKKVPRQAHPQADKAAQDEYKKNSQKVWLPNH